jgi:hypothetical protein
MIRLAWLQSRTQNTVAAGLLAGVAVLLVVTGPHLAHLYDDTVANCAAQHDCQLARDALLRHNATLRDWLDLVVIAVPALVGIFWGAPLVAREFESGTYRLIWTQSISRARWLAQKLATLGIATIVLAGLLSLIVTWWAGPLDNAHMARFTRFDERDLVPIAYAAFAFALAACAGAVIRRTLPAIAASLFVFIAARIAAWHFVRPHLAAVKHSQLALGSAHRVGFVRGPSGTTFVAGDPSLPNAWILSNRIVDKGGHPATTQALHRFLQTACPRIAHPASLRPGRGGPGDPAAFQSCIAHFAASFHLAVTYQPSSHYWTLQWYESAIFVVAAVALVAVCFRLIRARV